MNAERIIQALLEAVEPDSLPTLKSVTDPERFERRVVPALDRMADALERGWIANAQYKDLKDSVNGWIEKTWNQVVAQAYLALDRSDVAQDNPLTELYYAHPALHTMGAAGKKVAAAEKAMPGHPIVIAARSLLTELAPLVSQMEQLKGMIVKKAAREAGAQGEPIIRGDAEVRKQAVLRPFLQRDDVQKVVTGLKEITAGAKVEHVRSFEEWLTQQVNEAAPSWPTMNRDSKLKINPIVQMVLRAEERGEDAAKVIKRIAETTVSDMHEKFISKNTSKLASIIAQKGNLKTSEVVSIRADAHSLSGVMRFTFEDGSAFDVMNQVVTVWSWSNGGFYRFPTTFHSVVLPDGTKMGRPSEERMNSVFLGKPSPTTESATHIVHALLDS